MIAMADIVVLSGCSNERRNPVVGIIQYMEHVAPTGTMKAL